LKFSHLTVRACAHARVCCRACRPIVAVTHLRNCTGDEAGEAEEEGRRRRRDWCLGQMAAKLGLQREDMFPLVSASVLPPAPHLTHSAASAPRLTHSAALMLPADCIYRHRVPSGICLSLAEQYYPLLASSTLSTLDIQQPCLPHA
jgi:hypothetical protein